MFVTRPGSKDRNRCFGFDLTEMEAKALGIPVQTAVAKFAETGRAITMDVQHGGRADG